MDPSAPALGIDFGATATKAALLHGGRVQLVLDDSRSHLPSAVWVPPRGDLELLRPGARAAADPARAIVGIKRLLGRAHADPAVRALDAGVGYRITSGPDGAALVDVGGTLVSPVQVVATVLRHVRVLAERRAGRPIDRAVLSIPVVTAPAYAPALRRAAALAGLDEVRLVHEPVAALWGARVSGGPGRRVLVCDYGGGTFDAALLVLDSTRVQVLATSGDAFLGGADFDVALADAVAGAVLRERGARLRADLVARAELVARCEEAKRALSSATEARLRVPGAWVEGGVAHDLDQRLRRAEVEPVWRPLVDRALATAGEALRNAGVPAQLIDDLLLVGGTNLIPSVRAAFACRFARQPTAIDASDVVVAVGLASIAAHAVPASAAPATLEPAPRAVAG